nr:hypothetical protein Iba_chr12aCG2020 [Ipomoea batatas]
MGSYYSCLLHGHSDLVCNFLYNIWRYIWCIPPSGRDSNIRNA